MEKNLPSHHIDHYNLSSAQHRARLLAVRGAAALPARRCRSLLPQTESREESGGHKPKPFHLTEGREKEMGGFTSKVPLQRRAASGLAHRQDSHRFNCCPFPLPSATAIWWHKGASHHYCNNKTRNLLSLLRSICITTYPSHGL